jgi:hypothetical protein
VGVHQGPEKSHAIHVECIPQINILVLSLGYCIFRYFVMYLTFPGVLRFIVVHELIVPIKLLLLSVYVRLVV